MLRATRTNHGSIGLVFAIQKDLETDNTETLPKYTFDDSMTRRGVSHCSLTVYCMSIPPAILPLHRPNSITTTCTVKFDHYDTFTAIVLENLASVERLRQSSKIKGPSITISLAFDPIIPWRPSSAILLEWSLNSLSTGWVDSNITCTTTCTGLSSSGTGEQIRRKLMITV
jgi:hypothetical protein